MILSEMNKKFAIYLRRILCILLCFLLLPTLEVNAGEQGTGETGSISFEMNNIAGLEMRLYKVAVADGHDGYTMTSDFAGYSIDRSNPKAAETFAEYVNMDGLAPIATAVSTEEKEVCFDNLEKGVYLLLGNSIKVGYKIYTPSPVLVELPCWDDSEQLLWDVRIEGKYTTTDPRPDDKPVELSVVKVWKNTENQTLPESVKIQLLADGKAVDPTEREDAIVVLTLKDNWSYTWTDLASNVKWTVAELEVPENYNVSLEENEKAYVVVNTYQPPSTPDSPGGNTPGGKLPQTGQIWWPVMILVCCGLVMLIIGVRLKKQD